ncbi:MAG: hypothetical protein QF638_01715 [Acidimicrobiales bacterium]|nr:hypothetical protein [Acidimicrobiales bacterium]
MKGDVSSHAPERGLQALYGIGWEEVVDRSEAPLDPGCETGPVRTVIA